MANNYKSSNKKWAAFWIGATVFIVVAAILAGLIGWRTSGFKDWAFGFGKPTVELPNTPGDDVIISDGENKGISLTCAKIAPEEFEDYGISSQALEAYFITATVTPADADIFVNKDFIWSAAWCDAMSDNVSDHIKVEQESNNPLRATVTCISSFSTPINVTCTYAYDTSVKATCRFDYLSRIDNIELSEVPVSAFFNGEFGAEMTALDFSDGTLQGNVKLKSFSAEVSEEFFNYVKGTSFYTSYLGSMQIDDLVVCSGTCDIYDDIQCIDNGNNTYTFTCDIGQFVFVDNSFGLEAYNTVNNKTNTDYLLAAFNLAARNTKNNFRFSVTWGLEYNGVEKDTYTYFSEWYSLDPESLYTPYTAVDKMQIDTENFVI